MANSLDIQQQFAKEFQARFGGPPGNQEPGLEQWKQFCLELIEERDRLREDNARLQRERDKYFQSLLKNLPPAPPEYDLSFEEAQKLCSGGKI